METAAKTIIDEIAPGFAEKQFSDISGPAGTGKTFLVKDWAAQAPGIALAATTGIASINLGEGTTINAMLGFFDTASLTQAYTSGFLNMRLRRLYSAGLRRIVLDEKSMLDADQLTMIVRAIEEVGGQGFDVTDSDPDSEKPQIGLTLVGDFAQLSPVKAEFAFQSPTWPTHFQDNSLKLTEIRRQTDREFIEAIQAVRVGRVKSALDYFGGRIEQFSESAYEGVTIFAKNDSVARYNQLKLDKLATPFIRFKSTRWGKQRSEWGNLDKHPSTWGIPQELVVKEKALVMVLANMREFDPMGGNNPNRPFIYVNGDLGTLESADGLIAKVTLQRTGKVVDVMMVTRDVTAPLDAARRKELKAQGADDKISDDGKYEILGQITYMPLRLAWASTVHKTQGLSLDNVQINIGDHFFKSSGMLYVALSRARTPGGLRLVGSPAMFAERCTVDPKVSPWL